MSIPSPAAADVAAAHRLITREEIFEGARQNVVHSWSPVGSGRPFVENVFWLAATLLFGFLKNVVVFPKTKDFFFHQGDV